MEKRPVDPSDFQALRCPGSPRTCMTHTLAHPPTFVCHHADARIDTVTRARTHGAVPESQQVRHLPELPLIQMHLGDSLFSTPVFCLLPLPKHTHTKRKQKKRPRPLPILLLVVPPKMRPDPEKAIGGGGCLEPASPAAPAPGEGVRERRQAAFM